MNNCDCSNCIEKKCGEIEGRVSNRLFNRISKIRNKIDDRINYLEQFREKVYLDYDIGTYYEDYVYKDAIKELKDLKEFIDNFDEEEK